MTSPTLGAVIRQRRLQLGMTQEQLAARIGGVKQAEISRLEQGRVQLPRFDRLQRIAAALDVPIGQLLAASGWTGADEQALWGSHRPRTETGEGEDASVARFA